jgi:tetratricopeptide (TPR) repeat protein/DNA-binding SARP family transcriptional activator
LGLLLARGGKLVQVAEIVDALWPQTSPATAVNIVQQYVGGLRRIFEPELPSRAEGAWLLRSGSGYRMRVSEGELDLLRFRALADRARQCDGPAETVALFNEALTLWHDKCCSDLNPDVRSHPIFDAIDREYIAAVTAGIDAALLVGHYPQEMVAAVRLAALWEPFNEPIYARLMLVLAALGSQAEALTVFDTVRTRLSDELGLDPGPELQTARQRVLRQDVTSPVTFGATGVPGNRLDLKPQGGSAVIVQGRQEYAIAAVPAQLPADVSDFTGRSEEVGYLCDLLGEYQGDVPIIVAAVGGSGGVGKTTLVVHVAHLLRERFPDGQLYVNLHGVGERRISASEVLGEFLRILGMPVASIPDSEDMRAAVYRSLLSSRRVLIVLDNAADAAQVRPLLPGSSTCRVMITSRSRLADLEAARLVDLDVLPPQEAVALLGSVAGRERLAAESEAAFQVVAACGRLPLAVRIAGGRLAARPTWSVATLASRLEGHRDLLNELQLGDLAVRASFELSYRALEVEQARVFRLLGATKTSDISLAAAAALLDKTVEETERMLESLVDAYLLETPQPGRYQVHDLTWMFAEERAKREDSKSMRIQALQRLLDFYLTTARQADRLVGVARSMRDEEVVTQEHGNGHFGNFETAARWLRSERQNIICIIQQSINTPLISPLICAELVDSLSGLLINGYWRDWRDTAKAVLAAAVRNGDKPAEALVCLPLGILAAEWRHDLETADSYLRNSLRLYEGSGDNQGEARALNNLGIVCMMRRRYDQAAIYLKRSLALRRAAGMYRSQSAILNNLGMVYVQLNAHDDARITFKKALEIARETGEYCTEASILNNIGNARHEQGYYASAVRIQEQCLELCRRFGLVRNEMFVLADLGRSYGAIGDHEQALRSCVLALQKSRELGATYIEAINLRELGDIYHRLGRDDEARDSWHKALTILEFLDLPEAKDLKAALTCHGPQSMGA